MSTVTFCPVSGRGQDVLVAGSEEEFSAQVPLLPVLVQHQICGVSWPGSASPRGVCLALQVRSA